MRFYAKFMTGFVFAVALLSGIAAVSGCSTLRDNETASRLVIEYATMKYIDQQPEMTRVVSAARVSSIATLIQSAAEDESASIDSLASLAISKLPTHLDTADRALAMGLIRIAAEELKKKVGSINPQLSLEVAKVMEWVKGACAIYTPNSATL